MTVTVAGSATKPPLARIYLFLLAVVIAVFGVYLGYWGTSTNVPAQIGQCRSLAGANVRTGRFDACAGSVLRSSAWESLGGLWLPAIAYGVFEAQVARRVRQAKLKELRGAGADRAQAVLRTTGIAVPRLMIDHGDRAIASAFGDRQASVIAVGDALIGTLERDAACFDAVILHEAAHIVHGDTRGGQFAVAVVRVLLAVATFMIVLSLLVALPSTGRGEVIGSAVRALALFGLAVMSLRAYTREREVFADLQVAAWSTDHDAQWRALRLVHDRGPGRFWWGRSEAWAHKALGFHPPVGTRLQMLSEPGRALRFGPLGALSAGVAAGMLTWCIAVPLAFFGAGGWLGDHALAVAGASAGVFFGAAMAMGLRSNRLAGFVSDRGRSGLPGPGTRWPVLGLAAAVGVQVGAMLCFDLAAPQSGWSAGLPPAPGAALTTLTVILATGLIRVLIGAAFIAPQTLELRRLRSRATTWAAVAGAWALALGYTVVGEITSAGGLSGVLVASIGRHSVRKQTAISILLSWPSLVAVAALCWGVVSLRLEVKLGRSARPPMQQRRRPTPGTAPPEAPASPAPAQAAPDATSTLWTSALVLLASLGATAYIRGLSIETFGIAVTFVVVAVFADCVSRNRALRRHWVLLLYAACGAGLAAGLPPSRLVIWLFICAGFPMVRRTINKLPNAHGLCLSIAALLACGGGIITEYCVSLFVALIFAETAPGGRFSRIRGVDEMTAAFGVTVALVPLTHGLAVQIVATVAATALLARVTRPRRSLF